VDQLGGNGNGSAWFAANDAAITNHPFYLKYSQTRIASIDVSELKTDMQQSLASTQASPILNYLKWLLDICVAVA